MSDRFHSELSDDRPREPDRRPEPERPPGPEPAAAFPPLPPWIARRLLGLDETVEWVRGPRYNPSWERYVTHPLLFLVALVLGTACFAAGRLAAGEWSGLAILPAFLGGGLVFASVFVLGFANAYFTRLVVTSRRLFILQGHEVVRVWRIEDLPRSLLRYAPRPEGGREEAPSVDLGALKDMLGGASDKFADAKSILSLGKRLANIKSREDDRRP
jgi:hypothetical protein